MSNVVMSGLVVGGDFWGVLSVNWLWTVEFCPVADLPFYCGGTNQSKLRLM